MRILSYQARRRAKHIADAIAGVGAPLSARDLPFDIGQRGVNKVLSQLVPRKRAFAKPQNVKTVCALLFASRSGSKWLGELLGSTGQINRIREDMKAKRLKRFATEHGIEELAECVESVIRVKAVGPLFAFKGGTGSLVPFVHSGAYEAYKKTLKVILMYRRDIVGQAISIRKATLTGVWHSRDGRQPSLSDTDYDSPATLKAVIAISDANARLRDFAVRNGHERIEVTYEDLCTDQQERVTAILAFLGCDPARAASPAS